MGYMTPLCYSLGNVASSLQRSSGILNFGQPEQSFAANQLVPANVGFPNFPPFQNVQQLVQPHLPQVQQHGHQLRSMLNNSNALNTFAQTSQSTGSLPSLHQNVSTPARTMAEPLAALSMSRAYQTDPITTTASSTVPSNSISKEEKTCIGVMSLKVQLDAFSPLKHVPLDWLDSFDKYCTKICQDHNLSLEKFIIDLL